MLGSLPLQETNQAPLEAANKSIQELEKEHSRLLRRNSESVSHGNEHNCASSPDADNSDNDSLPDVRGWVREDKVYEGDEDQSGIVNIIKALFKLVMMFLMLPRRLKVKATWSCYFEAF